MHETERYWAKVVGVERVNIVSLDPHVVERHKARLLRVWVTGHNLVAPNSENSFAQKLVWIHRVAQEHHVSDLEVPGLFDEKLLEQHNVSLAEIRVGIESWCHAVAADMTDEVGVVQKTYCHGDPCGPDEHSHGRSLAQRRPFARLLRKPILKAHAEKRV